MAEIYFVYVLRSGATGRFYTGSCQDLDDRLSRHNAGESKATKHGIPWRLVYKEECKSRCEAMQREKFFKTGKGREKLERYVTTAPNVVAESSSG